MKHSEGDLRAMFPYVTFGFSDDGEIVVAYSHSVYTYFHFSDPDLLTKVSGWYAQQLEEML